MLESITKDISFLKLSVKLWCLYLVQHMLHQIKAPQFYTDLGVKIQCWILLQMVKFKDFSRPLSVFQVLFKAIFFFKDFSRLFCANPGSWLWGYISERSLNTKAYKFLSFFNQKIKQNYTAKFED